MKKAKKVDSRLVKIVSGILQNAHDLAGWGLDTKNLTENDLQMIVLKRDPNLRRQAATKLIEGGVSQRQVAKLLGVDEGTVRNDVRNNSAKSAEKSRTSGAGTKGGRSKKSDDACDYDWSNVKEADFGNPSNAYRAQAEHFRREATHLASAYPLLSSKVDISVISETEIQAVREVAQAWADVAETLARRKIKESA
jgi:hypothetical protein